MVQPPGVFRILAGLCHQPAPWSVLGSPETLAGGGELLRDRETEKAETWRDKGNRESEQPK